MTGPGRISGFSQGEAPSPFAIFFGVTNSVQPFDFKFLKDHAVLTLLGGIRQSGGQRQGSLDQLTKDQAGEFEYIHVYLFVLSASGSCPVQRLHKIGRRAPFLVIQPVWISQPR